MEWNGKYFTFNEMIKSPTAMRLGIKNIPSEAAKENLCALVKNVLDPLREMWGAPIKVTSGYRCVKLNTAVGGSKTSQHTKGQAADICTLSDTIEDNKKLRDLLIKSGLPFDQLIDEYGCNWIHVSFSTSHNRRQMLSAKRIKGKTVYITGIK